MQRHAWIAIILTLMCGIALHARLPHPIEIAIGGDLETGKRLLDKPYLSGFWPPEPDPWQPPERAYRWSRPEWQLTWPYAGTGDWLARITVIYPATTTDRTYPLTLNTGHTTTMTFPTGGPSTAAGLDPDHQNQSIATNEETRVLWIMLLQQSESPRIQGTSTPRNSDNDRRELGIILKHAELQPLLSGPHWRIFQYMAVLIASLLVAYVAYAWVPLRWWLIAIVSTSIITWGAMTFASWWAMHSTVIVPVGMAALAMIGLHRVSTLRAASSDQEHSRLHPLWALLVILAASQLMFLWSPWLLSSDIRMHTRMFATVLNAELWFTAELPCEAGSSTVPYLPLAYIIMAPIGLIIRDPNQSVAALYAGAVVLHLLALWYWVRVLAQYRMSYSFLTIFVITASLSSLWWNAIHIGEMTNAWAHALFLVALASWFDARASMAQRVLATTAVLLSHTGVTLSYAMGIAGLAGYRWWQDRRIPWQLIGIHVAVGAGVLLTYYSGFAELIGQTTKFPDCPPNNPITTRFSRLPNMYPLFSFPFVVIMALRNRKNMLAQWYWVGITTIVLSLLLLVFRDQTVRWGIAFAPFVALAIAQAWSSSAHYGWAARIFYGTAIGYVVWTFYQQTWQRIITYLH